MGMSQSAETGPSTAMMDVDSMTSQVLYVNVLRILTLKMTALCYYNARVFASALKVELPCLTYMYIVVLLYCRVLGWYMSASHRLPSTMPGWRRNSKRSDIYTHSMLNSHIVLC